MGTAYKSIYEVFGAQIPQSTISGPRMPHKWIYKRFPSILSLLFAFPGSLSAEINDSIVRDHFIDP